MDGKYPYAEIATGSILDYPQEARVVEVYRDSEDKKIRIQSQMISHKDHPTHLSKESYKRAEIDCFENEMLRQKEKSEGIPQTSKTIDGVSVMSCPDLRGTDEDRNFTLEFQKGF